MKASNRLIEYYMPDLNEFKTVFGYKCESLGTLEGLEDIKSIGSKLNYYKFVSRDIIRSVCEKVYMLDVLKASVMFKKENMFCYPTFVENASCLVVNLKGVCHPCIDIKKVMVNDFEYNGKNVIITGPNAGGKSTFMKSLLVNVLLSQSIGISNSTSCETTIFDTIISQINIPDCKGKESLFEAEMKRSKKTIDHAARDSKTFIVMDELFNSTNPVEGIAGGYSVCKKLSKCRNALLVLSTHYEYLTRLEKDTDRFANFNMNVKVNCDGIIEFPYKINQGISTQYIALELLKINGFDEGIIKEALSLKSRILSSVSFNK
jgi:DNA mismatch repair ATPase MutS